MFHPHFNVMASGYHPDRLNPAHLAQYPVETGFREESDRYFSGLCAKVVAVVQV
jgi:hypothetical protein